MNNFYNLYYLNTNNLNSVLTLWFKLYKKKYNEFNKYLIKPKIVRKTRTCQNVQKLPKIVNFFSKTEFNSK